MTGPLEGGTLRPVAEGPRVSLHGVPCGRARLHRGGRDPPGPLVPCGLGGTWRVPVTCSKRPPKAAGPEGKARARMGVCSHSPGQVSLTPSPAGRPGSGRAGSGLGDGRPRGHGGCRVGTSSSPTGPSPVPRLLPFHALFPVLLASKLGAAEPVPPQRRAAARDGPPGRTVPPGTCPLAGGQLGDHPVTHPRAHSHSSVHPHSVFCSGLSAGTHRGDQMNTPLARPLQGRGLRAAGGGNAAQEPKRKWGQKVSCPRGFVCAAHVLRRGHGHVSPVSRRPGPGRAAGECALASVRWRVCFNKCVALSSSRR